MAEKVSSRVKAVVFMGLGLGALVVMVVGFYVLFQSYTKQITNANQREATTYVIVAYTDLYQGVTIMEKDLFAVEIPPKYLYQQGAAQSGLFNSPEHVVGRIPRERILANEFIREERLADPESGTGLNALIPRNMRAISVGINGGAAVGEFLEPGNYVDMLVTLVPQVESSKQAGVVETHTMLQSVHVLAVGNIHGGMGSQDRKRDGDVGSVTLSVTPSQAEKISYAMSVGQITLLLRNDMDDETIEDAKGVGLDDILPPDQKKPALRIIQEKAPQVTVSGPSICVGANCQTVRYGGYN